MAICVKTAIDDIVENLDVESNPSLEYVSIKSDLDVLETSATTKIIAKIFLNDFATNSIEDAMENLLKTVQGRSINTVILAYHPLHDGEATNKDKFVWANDDAQSKENLKVLWNQLRTFVASGKVRFKMQILENLLVCT